MKRLGKMIGSQETYTKMSIILKDILNNMNNNYEDTDRMLEDAGYHQDQDFLKAEYEKHEQVMKHYNNIIKELKEFINTVDTDIDEFDKTMSDVAKKFVLIDSNDNQIALVRDLRLIDGDNVDDVGNTVEFTTSFTLQYSTGEPTEPFKNIFNKKECIVELATSTYSYIKQFKIKIETYKPYITNNVYEMNSCYFVGVITEANWIQLDNKEELLKYLNQRNIWENLIVFIQDTEEDYDGNINTYEHNEILLTGETLGDWEWVNDWYEGQEHKILGFIEVNELQLDMF